jgi:hypothetical protein
MSACPRWSEVKTATRAGLSPPEIVAHVVGCDLCAEELLSSGLQRWNSELSDTSPADPIVLWWKGVAARHIAAMDRAARPLTVVQTAALAIASLSAAGTALAVWAGGAAVAGLFEGLGVALGGMAAVMVSAALIAFRSA